MSLDDRIRDAQHRIEELWNETDGKCYVSFSGGKDSTVLLALIKMCQDLYTVGDIPAVFSNTGIELGVTVDFVRWVKENYYPNVQVIRPVKSFDWVLKNEGKPVKSKMKSKDLHQYHYGKRTEKLLLLLIGKAGTGKSSAKHKLGDKDMHLLHDDLDIVPSDKCCAWMKKKPFEKYAKDTGMKGAMQGVRQGEGGARDSAVTTRLWRGGKLCTWVKNGIIQKAPIIDWSDEDVEEFIQKYNVPLSDAYTKYGFKRTGCMGCPYSRDIASGLEYLWKHEPNRYKASMHWLKDVYILQNVSLPFDQSYEREREREWHERYEPMRQEMLRKYRPNSRLIKDAEQMDIFDYLKEEDDGTGNDKTVETSLQYRTGFRQRQP